MSFEAFLTNKAAEMVGFTVIRNFEFSCILVVEPFRKQDL